MFDDLPAAALGLFAYFVHLDMLGVKRTCRGIFQTVTASCRMAPTVAHRVYIARRYNVRCEDYWIWEEGIMFPPTPHSSDEEYS